MEVEAVDEGVLAEILVPEGTDNVTVNTKIAFITGEGEAAPVPQRRARTKAARQRGRPPMTMAARAPPRVRRARSRPPSALAAAAQAVLRRLARGAGRHRDGDDDGARGAARRHGRRDAARRGRLRHRRGGRRVSGRLQGHAGPAAGVRRPPRHRHADHRARLRRPRRRRGLHRPEADRRVHDLQLRHAGDRPDHQFGRQDALHVGRPDGLPDRVPRPERRRGPRRRPAQPGLFGLVLARPRPQGRRALYAPPTPRGCSRPRSAIRTR